MDSFEIKAQEQIRVLRVVDNGSGEPQCVVELGRPKATKQERAKIDPPSRKRRSGAVKWKLFETLY